SFFSRSPEIRPGSRPAWKSCEPARVPRVRIPVSPLTCAPVVACWSPSCDACWLLHGSSHRPGAIELDRCSRHDGFCSRPNRNREPKKFPSGRSLSCLPGAPLPHLCAVVHTRESVAPMRCTRIRLTQPGELTTLVFLPTGAVGSACASAGAGSDLFFQEGGSATNAQEGTDSSSGLDPEAGSGGANGGGDAVASPVGSGGASDATGGDDGGGGGGGPVGHGRWDSTGNCVPGMDDTAGGMGGGTCSDCTTVGGTCRADGTCSRASGSSSGGSSS